MTTRIFVALVAVNILALVPFVLRGLRRDARAAAATVEQAHADEPFEDWAWVQPACAMTEPIGWVEPTDGQVNIEFALLMTQVPALTEALDLLDGGDIQ